MLARTAFNSLRGIPRAASRSQARPFSIMISDIDDLQKHLKGPKPVVVDFFATWCGPCKHISPVFEQLEEKNKDMTFLKVDVDNNHDIVEQFGVSSMPTFLFFNGKDQKPVDTLIGASDKQLESKVANLKVLASKK